MNWYDVGYAAGPWFFLTLIASALVTSILTLVARHYGEFEGEFTGTAKSYVQQLAGDEVTMDKIVTGHLDASRIAAVDTADEPRWEQPVFSDPGEECKHEDTVKIRTVAGQVVDVVCLSCGEHFVVMVKEFQRIHGLEADGIVGPRTKRAFEKEHCS